MDDLSFPVLVGTALPVGIKFVLDQLGAFLDRRRLRREGVENLPQDGVVELPEFVTAHGPRQLDDTQIDIHGQEIEMLHALLSLSAGRNDLDGAEAGLRIMMARAKTVLEAVYHQEIDFVSDEKEATMVAKQRLDDVHGQATGLNVKVINPGGHAEVDQTAKTVHETGEVTAARIERLG